MSSILFFEGFSYFFTNMMLNKFFRCLIDRPLGSGNFPDSGAFIKMHSNSLFGWFCTLIDREPGVEFSDAPRDQE